MQKITRFVRRFLPNFQHGVHNLIYWIPVIWLDRDWDYIFLFRIMRHKLLSMEREIRVCPALDAERQANHIHEAILLLNRLIAFDYEENAFVHHRQKWGEAVISTYPADGDRVIIQLSYTNVQTPEQEEQANQEAMRLHKHVEYMEKQDIWRLFDILRRHVQNWWD